MAERLGIQCGPSGKVGDPGNRRVSGIYCWGGKKTTGYPERKFGKSARSLGRGSLRHTIKGRREVKSFGTYYPVYWAQYCAYVR